MLKSIAGIQLTATQGKILLAALIVGGAFLLVRWMSRRQVLDPSNNPALSDWFDQQNPNVVS